MQCADARRWNLQKFRLLFELKMTVSTAAENVLTKLLQTHSPSTRESIRMLELQTMLRFPTRITRAGRSGACRIVFFVLMAGGCQQSQSAPTKTTEKPAKTSHPVAEALLNTIELTADAVRRLGLEIATVEERKMVRTRPYGAEIALPTGATVVVSAPLAGTLKAVDAQGQFQVGQRVNEGRPLLNLLPLLSPERSVLTPA